jgi:hypothetical protein
MTLRRQLLVAIGLQGGGAISVLLATLMLGAYEGASAQGAFSRVKAEIEFVAAFAMFGLPQALFFHVKAGLLDLRTALRWATGSALVALPLTVAYIVLSQPESKFEIIALYALAVAACVAYSQLRSILLVRDRLILFNLITAIPQWLMLAGVTALILSDLISPLSWPPLFALIFSVAAALSWAQLRSTPVATPHVATGWRALVHYGLAAWLIAALSTAATVAVQRWVEHHNGSEVLGQFTMAMTLMQMPLTPISYAAPVLLRHWMEQPAASMARRAAIALASAGLMIAGAVASLSSVWPDLGLGPDYTGVTLALAVLLTGAAAEAALRLLSVQAHALGQPWIMVYGEVARWIVLLASAALWPVDGLLPVCTVWATAAWAAAALTWRKVLGAVPEA